MPALMPSYTYGPFREKRRYPILCSMSLYKRGEVWWSRIERGGQTIQRSTKCRNVKDARQVESVWLSELAKGEAGIFKPPTLFEFSDRFINYLPGRVSERTFGYYATGWSTLIHSESPLQNVRLNQMDSQKIEAYITWRQNRPYVRGEKGQERTVGATAVNSDLRTLRRALHLAAEWKLIPQPPKIRLLRGEVQRECVITEAELSRFLALCDSEELGRMLPFKARRFHPEMRAVLPFLIDVGLRAGELCRLDWTDANLEGRGSVTVRFGKTKNARRTVPLTARAKAILESLPRNGTAVFQRNSQRITVGWASHQFTAMRRRLNLPGGMVLHSCRHTFCSRLGAKGVSPYVLQKLAGHASIIISARYCHPDTAQLESAVGLLE
jgi:integrase